MLDFPTSPALNDTFRDWKWDGEKWAGAPTVADPPSNDRAYGLKNGLWTPVVWRQRIDFSGVNGKDVPVPAGAKMMRWMIGPQQVGTTSGYIMMQWSDDGSTFWQGASQYGVGGTYHGVGSTFGKITPSYTSAGAYISWTHNHATFPHLSRGFMTLTRADDTRSFISVFRTEVYNASYPGMMVQAYNWSSGPAGARSIKALRIYLYGGALFAAEAQISLEWIS